VGPRTNLDVVEKNPYQEPNPHHPAQRLITIQTKLSWLHQTWYSV